MFFNETVLRSYMRDPVSMFSLKQHAWRHQDFGLFALYIECARMKNASSLCWQLRNFGHE